MIARDLYVRDPFLCGYSHVRVSQCWQAGPYFTAGDLADIAHELDERERNLMMEAGYHTADAIRFAAVRL